MKKETIISNSLKALFNHAYELSKRHETGEINYPFVVGYYEAAMMEIFGELNLSKKQLEILKNQCEIN